MLRTRRAAGALAAAVLLGGCDNNEYLLPPQSAGGSGGGGTFLATDPTGDLRAPAGDGAPDATAMSGSVSVDTITVKLTFRSPVSPWSAGRLNSLTGFIDLDLDESPSTGIAAEADQWGGDAGQGVEYYVSLRDDGESRVALVNVATQQAVSIPATFAATSVTVRIPRALLADETPGFTLSAVVGHPANEATDLVPNSGHVKVRH